MMNRERARRFGQRVYTATDPEPCVPDLNMPCTKKPANEAQWYVPGHGPMCDDDLGFFLDAIENHAQTMGRVVQASAVAPPTVEEAIHTLTRIRVPSTVTDQAVLRAQAEREDP